MIRQITINCSERGLLLVRVRDEIRMVTQPPNRRQSRLTKHCMNHLLRTECARHCSLNKKRNKWKIRLTLSRLNAVSSKDKSMSWNTKLTKSSWQTESNRSKTETLTKTTCRHRRRPTKSLRMSLRSYCRDQHNLAKNDS